MMLAWASIRSIFTVLGPLAKTFRTGASEIFPLGHFSTGNKPVAISSRLMSPVIARME
jgi:hypothetical protein